MKLSIEFGNTNQEMQLLNLYTKVADQKDGIIRKKEEINSQYISDFLNKSIKNGLILVGQFDGKIVAEIHAYTPSVFAFQHILTDLTIVVDNDYQGQGIGRKIFEEFLKIVEDKYDHILRVELYTREHNKRNINFYESLGFRNEGRQEFKILKKKGEFETPIHMAWFNPKYYAHSDL
jgi:ribosomal protein S18 acetylase RimI-like enzyme